MARTRSGSGSTGDAGFLNAALLGFEQQRSEIQDKIAELRRQLGRRGAGDGGSAWSEAVSAPVRKRRRLSAAARQRIAEAQRKRWAAVRGTAKPVARKAAAGPRRTMSAAAKKRIADAARKRWAAFRANKATASAQPKVKTAGA